MSGPAALLGVLARPLVAGPLFIFAYHRVAEREDPMHVGEVPLPLFERQIRFLASAFEVLPLADAVERLRSGTLPRRAACITFDDGYASNFTVALPVLRRHGLPATFFVATGFLDGGRMWNDTVIEAVRRTARDHFDLSAFGLGRVALAGPDRAAVAEELLRRLRRLDFDVREACVADIAAQCGAPLPADLMMSSRQVRELHALGYDVGGHTVSHPILARLPADRARAEIVRGRAELAAITGEAPRTFAYPNGHPGVDYTLEHVAQVREAGFTVAVTTAFGTAGPADDPLQLPRIVPWNQDAARFGVNVVRARRAPPAKRA